MQFVHLTERMAGGWNCLIMPRMVVVVAAVVGVEDVGLRTRNAMSAVSLVISLENVALELVQEG